MRLCQLKAYTEREMLNKKITDICQLYLNNAKNANIFSLSFPFTILGLVCSFEVNPKFIDFKYILLWHMHLKYIFSSVLLNSSNLICYAVFLLFSWKYFLIFIIRIFLLSIGYLVAYCFLYWILVKIYYYQSITMHECNYFEFIEAFSWYNI